MSRNSREIFEEIKRKVHEVLWRGYDRKELTLLVPAKDYNELILINDTFTINNISVVNDVEVETIIGVTVKPLEGLDKIYVCL